MQTEKVQAKSNCESAAVSVRIKRVDADMARSLLPFPDVNANKYSRGKMTLIGGCSDYPGAACLASKAAEVMGAGYVELFCAPQTLPVVHGFAPSVVARDWNTLSMENSTIASPKKGDPQACLIGSGFSATYDIERKLFFEALECIDVPLVVDGAAITYLSSAQGHLHARMFRHPLVVTPHAGEAARLAAHVGVDIPDKDDHEPQVLAQYALELARAYNATIVLKGPDTYIASTSTDQRSTDSSKLMDQDGSQKNIGANRASDTVPSECVFLMDRGTSALSKAGTGDVLAGMIASLLAQGLSSVPAACLGTYLHAESGRVAAEKLTDICVCAEDIVCFLPETIGRISAGY